MDGATPGGEPGNSRLDPSPELLSVLRDWGIHHLGQLTSLPGGELMDRMGAEALRREPSIVSYQRRALCDARGTSRARCFHLRPEPHAPRRRGPVAGTERRTPRKNPAQMNRLFADTPGAVTSPRRCGSDQERETYRYLVAEPLQHLSGTHLAAAQGGLPDPALDLEQGSAALEEFLAARIVVIGAPMYNFGIPNQLKAWIDRLAVAGKTFRYTESGIEGLAGGLYRDATGFSPSIVSSAVGLPMGDPETDFWPKIRLSAGTSIG